MERTDKCKPSVRSIRPGRRRRRTSVRGYGRLIIVSLIGGAATTVGSALVSLLAYWLRHYV